MIFLNLLFRYTFLLCADKQFCSILGHLLNHAIKKQRGNAHLYAGLTEVFLFLILCLKALSLANNNAWRALLTLLLLVLE